VEEHKDIRSQVYIYIYIYIKGQGHLPAPAGFHQRADSTHQPAGAHAHTHTHTHTHTHMFTLLQERLHIGNKDAVGALSFYSNRQVGKNRNDSITFWKCDLIDRIESQWSRYTRSHIYTLALLHVPKEYYQMDYYQSRNYVTKGLFQTTSLKLKQRDTVTGFVTQRLPLEVQVRVVVLTPVGGLLIWKVWDHDQ